MFVESGGFVVGKLCGVVGKVLYCMCFCVWLWKELKYYSVLDLMCDKIVCMDWVMVKYCV